MKEMGDIVRVYKRTIVRLWKRAKGNAACNCIYESPSMKHLSSRKPRDLSSVLEQLRHVDLQQRTTIRATSRKCIVPPTILFRCLKQGKMRSCMSVVKPALNDGNLKIRIKF
ncbi:hypothetical protein PI126_g9129 [Phytophthora idaei]|nr:hypothetical protein PI126_g9129 [Phytophthora idaei]